MLLHHVVFRKLKSLAGEGRIDQLLQVAYKHVHAQELNYSSVSQMHFILNHYVIN